MELVTGILIVVVALFLLSARKKPKPERERSDKIEEEVSVQQVVDKNAQWLEERWEGARKERDAGELKTVPRWFFDEATERQRERLKKMGLTLKATATKGEASDVIGLLEPADDRDMEILRFFKVPTKGINQTRARHEVAQLFSKPANVEAWNSRPASAMQKEFFRYFGLKVPSNLTYQEAECAIEEHLAKLAEENEQKVDEWDAYEQMFEEISDPGFREDYDIRAVSLSLYRSAIEELKKEGLSVAALADDIDRVVNKIIALKPDIQKT